MLNDKLARDRIVTDLDTTFLVEAGAGSGKTTSLVYRMVALIQTGKAQVQEIAAITFTRKAASELKSRFQLALEQALKDAVSPEEKHRLEKGLRDLNLCFMGTIHSFCGRLLRERPLEAKVDPDFREMEEDEAREFRDACWDDYLAELQEQGNTAQLAQLTALGIDVEHLRAVYHKVSEYVDVEIAVTDTPCPNATIVRDSLFELVEEAAKFLPTNEPERGWDPLQEAVRLVQSQRRFRDFSNVVDLANLLESAFEKSLSVIQNRWTDKARAKQLGEQFSNWQKAVMAPFLREWREYKHPLVIRFVRPAVEYCTRRREEAGLLNFQDLLMKAAALLRSSAEVRRYFQHRFPRLFVDEFQDTDPIQAGVMFLLTGEDVHESDWRKAVPRPGSLFIVGDPKQSIYRFRRADIATYNFVKTRIESCGEVLQLSANFRSIDAIGDFVNAHFQAVFPAEETLEQARFVQLDTQRSNPSDFGGVYKLCHPKSLRNKEAVTNADAARIARWIRWACDGNVQISEYDANGQVSGGRPATPGDFMILTYKKELMHIYGEQLETFGIPFEIVDSQQTYRELQDLSELVRCLAGPTDKVALVATLRGIFFGVSDNSLYHYKREGHSLSLHRIPAADDVSDVARPVQRALEELRQYLGWTQSLPALTALSRMLAKTGYLSFTALQPSGMTRAGAIATLLQQMSSQGMEAMSWRRLADSIARIAEQPSFAASSLFPGKSDSVRIMNLHKAKGLEAPIVFLAGPCGYQEREPDTHVDRSGEIAAGYFKVEKVFESKAGHTTKIPVAQPVHWDEWAAKETRFLKAERNRLLYVATTRARQMLVVSHWEDNASKDPWSPLADALADVPELEDVVVEQPERPLLDEPIDIAAFLEAQEARMEQIQQPTWRRTSVTTEAKASVAQWERRSGGLGMAFGSAVHRCMEACGKGLAPGRLPTFARVASREAGLSEEHVEDVVRTVEGVLASDLWARAAASKQRLHEIPFVLTESSSSASVSGQETAAGLDTTGQEEDIQSFGHGVGTLHRVILHGVIDMAFEEEDGWVIVDFKTDAFQPEHESQFVEFYRAQLEQYVAVWQGTFGYPVKEAGLYFTNWHRYVTVL
ncbi:ATP-dependent DNA helicase [Alicyclobacillus contaminans]|uniref:UvrD-helicase domain-containing protein n=1 Tax=Alicyclobacillus contaminans TaxID=392016 RepID=UPI00041489F9|nr:UvrD-helicase domain-containing protein [Alicyclobacillus contaminans]GMA49398.1 ATP-dependent DNA helicase [Alicyclobacillus contaminans]